MKAVAVFPRTREIKLIEHEEPKITTPTQVKLRTLEVGVCGTDKKITSFQFGSPPAGFDYFVIGHEMIGEVVEVGAQVHGLRPGDLAVTMVRHPCLHDTCRACRMEQQDFCFTGDYTEHGIKESHGFMTEFVVDEERYLLQVPHTLRDIGVLTEPLTVVEKGMAEVWHIQQRLPWFDPHAPTHECGKGLKALVLGAGPVGLLTTMLLVATRFETYVYSRSRKPNPKAALVEAIGSTYISSETTTVKDLARQIGAVDLIFEAAGTSQLAFAVMQIMGTNAIFVFAGTPESKSNSSVDIDILMHNYVLKNQTVIGTVNAGKASFEAAIRDLAVFEQRWPGVLSSLITGRYSLEQAPQLLLGHLGDTGGIKNLVTL